VKPGHAATCLYARADHHQGRRGGAEILQTRGRMAIRPVLRIMIAKDNAEKHKFHRRSIRLEGYDYASEGAYFVTICIRGRQCLFGRIMNGDATALNEFGEIVRDEWSRTAEIRTRIVLDEFVVVPNHIHGIIIVDDAVPTRRGTRPRAGGVGAYGQTPRSRAYSSTPLRGARDQVGNGHRRDAGATRVSSIALDSATSAG
jgi:hypothetical protein